MGGRRWTAVFVAVAVVAGGLIASQIAASAGPPPAGFTDQEVLSGLDLPTNLAFSPDGRVFVAEKGGVIKVYDSLSDPTPSVFADLSAEVYSYGDLGMTGLTLHPELPGHALRLRHLRARRADRRPRARLQRHVPECRCMHRERPRVAPDRDR